MIKVTAVGKKGAEAGRDSFGGFMSRYLFLFLGHLLPLSIRRFLLVEVKLRVLFGLLQGLLPPVVLCSVLYGLTDALEHLGPLLGVLQSYGLHCSLVQKRVH